MSKITHITSVSGGSILGAHLALNWERYCGTPEQFDETADEIIRFVQLDVRNRIVRRFPLASVANKFRTLMFMSPRRQWTRAGLLERYYERFLYGDTPLSQLPDHPKLHILSTNLSEGCLCSFNRNGLLMQRRVAGRRDTLERVNIGLATVPMAVAASSCFPGFFPPLELSGWDVGAEAGEFSRQAFTDGGVYDNLGLRMFRHLDQSRVQYESPLSKSDFLALEDTISALRAAENLPDDTPIGRLRKLLDRYVSKLDKSSSDSNGDPFANSMVNGLWDLIQSKKLYSDPVLGKVELDDPSAQTMLNYAADSQRQPDAGDRLWLNRMIVESALRQVIGKPCLRISRNEFKGILVSDAGGKFKVNRNGRGGGLLSTALRSSDILMDRVWQLESEVFENTSGVVFIPIIEVIDRIKDPHVLDPEIQRQSSKIRTDLDRFTDLEVSSLVQHGYGVARQICHENADLLQCEVPNGRPWDPMNDMQNTTSDDAQPANSREQATANLLTARKLRSSSKRKILSTILSLRDWPSYVWILLILLLAAGIVRFIQERSERLSRQETVLSAVAQLDPDYQMIVDLLRNESESTLNPMVVEDVETLENSDISGFDVISDSRVFDLRKWNDPKMPSRAKGYSRTRVRRLASGENNSILRLQRNLSKDEFLVECSSKSLDPRLYRMKLDEGSYRYEMRLDFSHVPLDSYADVSSQSHIPSELAGDVADGGRLSFSVQTNTGILQVWLLMPDNRPYGLFEVSSHPIGEPENSKIVVPAAAVRAGMGSVATFLMINPEPNRRYECRWTWEQPD